MNDRDLLQLESRVEDLLRDCVRRCMPRFLGYLSPEDAQRVRRLAASAGDVFVLSFGVFPDAERVIAGFFPSDVYLSPSQSGDADAYREMAETALIRVDGSGYASLDHRSLLGSLMALGITRESVGDIRVLDDAKTAFVATTAAMADYIALSLERVGKDAVKVKKVSENEAVSALQRYEDRVVSLASLRLDAFVAAVCGVSRENAKKLIAAGKVSVDHSEVTACDRNLTEKNIVSVRGYGKFLLDGGLGTSAKGRERIVVRKYV